MAPHLVVRAWSTYKDVKIRLFYHKHTHAHTPERARAHTRTHTHTHTHARTHAHTNTHIHTHTQTSCPLLLFFSVWPLNVLNNKKLSQICRSHSSEVNKIKSLGGQTQPHASRLISKNDFVLEVYVSLHSWQIRWSLCWVVAGLVEERGRMYC